MRRPHHPEAVARFAWGPVTQRLMCAVAFGLHLSSCSAPVTPPANADTAADPSLVQIGRLIGVAACRTDEQCRVTEIGWRPCGGPESFRAWSTRDTNAQALQVQLDRYAQKRRSLQEQEGLLSTCQVLPKPMARCASPTTGGPARCVLEEGTGVR